MYLNIGKDMIIRQRKIIGIFDIDNTTSSKITKEFLIKAQNEKNLINVCEGIPKSFVIYEEENKNIVYLSQFAPSTLMKRCENFEEMGL